MSAVALKYFVVPAMNGANSDASAQAANTALAALAAPAANAALAAALVVAPAAALVVAPAAAAKAAAFALFFINLETIYSDLKFKLQEFGKENLQSFFPPCLKN